MSPIACPLLLGGVGSLDRHCCSRCSISKQQPLRLSVWQQCAARLHHSTASSVHQGRADMLHCSIANHEWNRTLAQTRLQPAGVVALHCSSSTANWALCMHVACPYLQEFAKRPMGSPMVRQHGECLLDQDRPLKTSVCMYHC